MTAISIKPVRGFFRYMVVCAAVLAMACGEPSFEPAPDPPAEEGTRARRASRNDEPDPDEITSRPSITELDIALVQAAARGNAGEVGELLLRGAWVDAADERGLTALMAAARRGHAETLEVLLDATPNLDLIYRGETALGHAVRASSIPCVEMLVHSGADVDLGAPLLVAADGAVPKVALILIESSPYLEVEDRLGRTPLHLAARAGYVEVVDALIVAGADVWAEDNKGWTARDLAARAGKREVVEAIDWASSN